MVKIERYFKNIGTLAKEENESLSSYKVCVIGCGGLGGYIIEMLGRLGIGHITAVDSDVFEESNLNRQLLANTETLSKPKALAAKERMKLVNPLVEVITVCEKFAVDNAERMLTGHDVIVDAVDNIESRFTLQNATSKLGIPLVHGAIAGWYGQVSTILPGDNTLERIYPSRCKQGLEKEIGNPSFTPAMVASIQVAEVIKVLFGKGSLLRNKLLYIDLLEHEYIVIDLK
ncbi:MAG: HesA/MoeB/ThiF family protein [Alkaliphilus sp.]